MGLDREAPKAKAEYYNPIAFAHRANYDLDAAWGKGFVWVAPKASPHLSWDFPYRLHGIVLHEVGHVLGCEHVRGTILTEDIANLIRTASTSPEHVKALLTTIDGEAELKLRMNDLFDYKGKISRWGIEETEKTFKLFVGRAPVGKVLAHHGKLFLRGP